MIPKQEFGRTGHRSTRVIFGSYALSRSTPEEADGALALLKEHGINHIDTAPMYGSAEQLMGSWMEKHQGEFFIATKTRSRSREGAMDNLKRSLERLRVEAIDLWQMHGLTNPAGWERAMGAGGTLEALLEAREAGLVRFLGVTGHGSKVPAMHLRSLERFDFDAVMLPYNYMQMQHPRYAADFNHLVDMCKGRNVAVQTMKCIARTPCRGRSKTYNTYFYEPLEAQEAIDRSVHWSLGLSNSFLITAGDLHFLPMMLDAACRFETRPTDTQMDALAESFDLQTVFA